MSADDNLKAYVAAVDAFNKSKGADLSAITGLMADDFVHHNAAPGLPDIVGKVAWLAAATDLAKKGGWTNHEILAGSAADEFSQVVARNTLKHGYETFAGVCRWRDDKMVEVWSLGQHPS